MQAGMIGAIIGGSIGLLGAAVGTWAGIRNTHSEEERQLMVRAAIGMWVAVLTFVALLFLMPPRSRWMLWMPYGILLPLAIRRLNQRQTEIRARQADALSRGTAR